MTSPFQRRASELIPSDGAFLAHVAPAPLEVYFQQHGESDALYDRLTVVTGSPGSGKTTIARLFQFHTLLYLHRHADQPALGDLYQQMADCRAVDGDYLCVAGARLSMEINYRDFWECPYEASTKHWLTQALISARAVLGWAREFTEAGVPLTDVRAVFRTDTAAGADAVGGESLEDMRKVAVDIERETYHIATALIAPPPENFSDRLKQGYQPLETLKSFVITQGQQQFELRPLIMLDDMHALHVEQRDTTLRWLVRRDIAIARWVLWRFDALRPDHVLHDRELSADFGSTAPGAGVQVPREITDIRLQQGGDRRAGRTQFRKMAHQMGRRYLNQMEIFKSEGVESLEEMLEKRMTDISPSTNEKIASRTRAAIKRANLPPGVVEQLELETSDYLSRRDIVGNEATAIKEGMMAILVARTVKKTPQSSFFDSAVQEDDAEDIAAKPKPGVEQGARIQLANQFGIPFYYGPDALFDAGSENAEQFLQMAAPMVDLLRVKTIRRRQRILNAKEQHQALVTEAERIVKSWNFPESTVVRRLAEAIARECIQRTMQDSAPLGAGASAIGIPMDDFSKIVSSEPNLARALQFGVAYNVLTLVPNYGTKRRLWCLIELGGAMLIKTGLTFQKGGFVEKRLSHVLEYLQEDQG